MQVLSESPKTQKGTIIIPWDGYSSNSLQLNACTCAHVFVCLCVLFTNLDRKLLGTLAEDLCIVWFCSAFLLCMLTSRKTNYSTTSILRRLYNIDNTKTYCFCSYIKLQKLPIRTRTRMFVAFKCSSCESSTIATVIMRSGTVAFTVTFVCATFTARRARRKLRPRTPSTVHYTATPQYYNRAHCMYVANLLPGQLLGPGHAAHSVAGPGHSVPLYLGLGLLHARKRFLPPLLHVVEQ